MNKVIKVHFFLLAIIFSINCYSQDVDTSLWGTNYYVSSMARQGDTLYIGGGFTEVGPYLPYGILYDSTKTYIKKKYPKPNGIVRCVIPDGAGGWYIGGDFTMVGEIARNRLAQIDTNGNISSWNPNADAAINTMVKVGSKIFVGGSFTKIGSLSQGSIGAIDSATGIATNWAPSAPYIVGGSISTMAAKGGIIYFGGTFTQVNGQSRSRIAAINQNGGLLSWNPNLSPSSCNAIAIKDTIVFIGGSFNSVSGQTRNNIAAVHATSGALLPWNPNANGMVRAIVIEGSRIYLGGSFQLIGLDTICSIAALDISTGSLIKSWDPKMKLGSSVTSIKIFNSNMYIGGGSFSSIDGEERRSFAVLDTVTGKLLPLKLDVAAGGVNPSSGSINGMSSIGKYLYIGGNFKIVGGVKRNKLAAIDLNTGKATAWNPNPTPDGGTTEIDAIAVKDSIVYVGGYFKNIGGQSRMSLAAINKYTGNSTSFNADVLNKDGTSGGNVSALLIKDNLLFVAGYFWTIKGVSRNNLACINLLTNSVTSWNPIKTYTQGDIHDMVVDGDKLIVGGGFQSIGTTSIKSLAKIDINSGNVVSTWDAHFPDGNQISSFTKINSTLYVNGDFTSINSQARNYLAALNLKDATVTSFSGPAVPYALWGHHVAGNKIYILGVNTGGAAGKHLAAIDALTGERSKWLPKTSNNISSSFAKMINYKSKLYIGSEARIQDKQDFPFFFALPLDESNKIQGTVFYDKNNNGFKDSLETEISNVKILLLPDSSFHSTDVKGNYSMYVNSGSYTVSLVLPGYSTGVSPATHTITFNSNDQIDSLNDFAVKLIPNVKDLNIDIENVGPARPGFDLKYHITYSNNGSIPQSGEITLNFDNKLDYQNSIPAHNYFNNDTVKWNYLNISPGENRKIEINIKIPGTVPAGAAIKSIAHIDPAVSDTTQSDNTDTVTQITTLSFDPNIKEVIPKDSITSLFDTKKLTYTIHFQNTGTDTAFNVTVIDTLDNNLDPLTFKPILASHSYNVILNKNIIKWTFKNIMLPDSGKSYILSQGFFKYSISPRLGLANGTFIKNQAAIYFDYNSPIITNQTTTKLLNISTQINSDNTNKLQSGDIEIFPNPNSIGQLMLTVDETIDFPYTFIIYDQQGKIVQSALVTKEAATIPISGLSGGLYLYEIMDSGKFKKNGTLIISK